MYRLNGQIKFQILPIKAMRITQVIIEAAKDQYSAGKKA